MTRLIECLVNSLESNHNSTALIDDLNVWSYSRLHEDIYLRVLNLREMDYRNNDFVFVSLKKCNESISTIIALLLIGCKVAPLKGSIDSVRNKYLRKHQPHSKTLFENGMDDLNRIVNRYVNSEFLPSGNILSNINLLDSGSLIFFTSGSTGLAKSVDVSLYSIYERISWLQDSGEKIKESEVCILNTSFTTIDSVWEIFGPLLSGCKLILSNTLETSWSPSHLSSLVFQYKVSRLCIVPSLFYLFLNGIKGHEYLLNSLKYIVLSGEDIPPNLIRLYRKLGIRSRLFNQYGLTETTADIFKKEIIGPDDINSIGSPVKNVQCLIKSGSSTYEFSPGVYGELLVSGPQISRYLSGDLNVEKFITINGTQYLCTGDVVVVENNGELTLKGRNDRQVNRNGNSFNLSELEHHAGRSEYVDVCKAYLNNEKVVLYIKPRIGCEDVSADCIYSKIPMDMIPDQLQIVEEFERTDTGKVLKPAKDYPEEKLDKKLDHNFAQLIALSKQVLGTDISVSIPLHYQGISSYQCLELAIAINQHFGASVHYLDLLTSENLYDLIETVYLKSFDLTCINNKKKRLSSFQKGILVQEADSDSRLQNTIERVFYCQNKDRFLEFSRILQDVLSEIVPLNRKIEDVVGECVIYKNASIEFIDVTDERKAIVKVIELYNEAPCKIYLDRKALKITLLFHHYAIDGYLIGCILNNLENALSQVKRPKFSYVDTERQFDCLCHKNSHQYVSRLLRFSSSTSIYEPRVYHAHSTAIMFDKELLVSVGSVFGLENIDLVRAMISYAFCRSVKHDVFIASVQSTRTNNNFQPEIAYSMCKLPFLNSNVWSEQYANFVTYLGKISREHPLSMSDLMNVANGHGMSSIPLDVVIIPFDKNEFKFRCCGIELEQYKPRLVTEFPIIANLYGESFDKLIFEFDSKSMEAAITTGKVVRILRTLLSESYLNKNIGVVDA